MGSRLRIINVVGALCLSATAMAQPGPLPTADLAKQGMDRYNVGDFAGAIPPLEKAVELEPNNFQYRLTLAESYRQTGQCPKAQPIYKALADQAPDAQSKATVDSGLAACPEPAITPPPPPPTPPPAPPPEPVVVHSSAVSTSNIGLLATAGIAVGLGAGLLFAAHTDASDASDAARHDDYVRISNRSDMLYVAGGITLAAGVVLGVVSLYRIKVSDEHDTTVAVSPHAGGGTLVLGGTW